MTEPTDGLYGVLASWWPLISPPEEYQDEATFIGTLLGDATAGRRSLLELGSGGGHVAAHLAPRFNLTLTDGSEPMLAMSRQLNPDAEHVCADMRTVRLGREFDVVLVHDAIDYMCDESDLRAALATVAVHLRPGGTAVVLPDATTEIFEPGFGSGGSDGPDGRSVRYLEWTIDPDPRDTKVTTDYVFMLRRRDEPLELVHETHDAGLFSRSTWLRLLHEAGLQATRISESTNDDRVPRDVFVATRP